MGVEEWLVSAVMSMYTGAKTVVRTVYGNSSGFEVKVGMHQGSALSPLLFVIVIRYDMIRWTILTCAQKLTSSQLSLPHGTKQKRIMKKLKQT